MKMLFGIIGGLALAGCSEQVDGASGAVAVDAGIDGDVPPTNDDGVTIGITGPKAPCTIFVAKDGRAGATGSSTDAHSKVQAAINAAKPGDVICVRPGTYQEGVRFRDGGEPGKPIVLRSESQMAVLEHPGGPGLLNGVEIWESDPKSGPIGWITVEGLEIRNFTNKGFELTNIHDVVIRGNYIHGSKNSGMVGGGTNYVVDSNVFSDNGDTNFDHGAYVNGTKFSVTNNVFAANFEFGLQLASSVNAVVSNNVFYGQTRNCGMVVYRPTSINDTIQNNIFMNNQSCGLSFYNCGTGHKVKNNLYFKTGPAIDSNVKNSHEETGPIVEVDPQFVDTAVTGFKLKAGSPALDKGEPSNAPATDRWGSPRPKGQGIDIGIHEL